VSEELIEILPDLIFKLKNLRDNDLSDQPDYSFADENSKDKEEKRKIILNNISYKQEKCLKHLKIAIHHLEDCLFKSNYDLSDVIDYPMDETN